MGKSACSKSLEEIQGRHSEQKIAQDAFAQHPSCDVRQSFVHADVLVRADAPSVTFQTNYGVDIDIRISGHHRLLG